jgi:hypothetical protein
MCEKNSFHGRAAVVDKHDDKSDDLDQRIQCDAELMNSQPIQQPSKNGRNLIR